MAIARCDNHPIERSTKEPYEAYSLPLGYPNTAAICGRVGCEEPAKIFLTSTEAQAHDQGCRILDVKTQSIKVMVSDDLVRLTPQ
ncbi:hypothetical protein FHS78_000101 [Parvibaculum indicum]|uniref:hypothetical protein n=1 Tax=Parvibaculum indicum TaxID=562969 RepID=UPI00141DFC0D|nr:hypothetical protein [Parvibaculum indicum]NIJ39846.1 hypothetical protein [Parvibaculum indicum]